MGQLVSGEVHYPDGPPEALNDAERAAGRALFCQAHALTDLVIEAQEIDAVKDIPIQTMPCRVARMEKVTHDVMVLHLKLPQQQRLQFLAGQYVDLLLRDGSRRSFSLANSPLDDEYLQLHVRHVDSGGGFTDHVFGTMQEKDLLRLEGPLGTFFLREDTARPVIFMAGGTGFGPIKAILEYAFAKGVTRKMHFFWGVRARRDLYMRELPIAWAQQYTNFRYTPVLSAPRREDGWSGRTGWVHEAVAQDYSNLADHDIYACGPPPMVTAGHTLFTAQGLDPAHYFSDSFEFAHDEPDSN